MMKRKLMILRTLAFVISSMKKKLSEKPKQIFDGHERERLLLFLTSHDKRVIFHDVMWVPLRNFVTDELLA